MWGVFQNCLCITFIKVAMDDLKPWRLMLVGKLYRENLEGVQVSPLIEDYVEKWSVKNVYGKTGWSDGLSDLD